MVRLDSAPLGGGLFYDFEFCGDVRDAQDEKNVTSNLRNLPATLHQYYRIHHHAMHTNKVSNTTPQNGKAANLALAKTSFLGPGKLTPLEDVSLSPLGSEIDQEEVENRSIDSTNCPSDEGAHEMIHVGATQNVSGQKNIDTDQCTTYSIVPCPKASLNEHNNSTQSDTECEAIEQVSRLLGEMADILDESVCSSTSTTDDVSNDNPISPLVSAVNAPEQPKMPINFPLLKQMANINTNLRDIDVAEDGQSALVEGNIIIETIEILFAERTEMIQEVLSLLEAAREETKALRDLPRHNANGATCGTGGGHSPGSKLAASS